MLRDELSLKKVIGEEIVGYQGLESVTIQDLEGNVLAHTGSDPTLLKDRESLDKVGDVFVEAGFWGDEEITVVLSSDVLFMGEKVGKTYVTLPGPGIYRSHSKWNIFFFIWVVFSILFLSGIIWAMCRQKKSNADPSDLLLLTTIMTTMDRQEKPTLKAKAPRKLGNNIYMFFQHIMLEIASQYIHHWGPIGKDHSQEAEGMRLGPYLLKEEIAQGNTGNILLAEIAEEDIHRKKFAVRRLWPHLAQNKEFIEMLRREVKFSELLGYHPNIVQTFGFREKQDACFIVMEYISGLNLAQILAKAGERLSVSQTVYIISQICLGLKFAYSDNDNESGGPLNIVHGDIKPGNILISFQGAVKIGDFGISKAFSEHSLVQDGLVKGGLSWISLEDVLGKPVDHQSDIYSLGVIFYEMLSGKKIDSVNRDNGIPSIKALVPDIPDELNNVVMKCLEKDENLRYQSAQDILADLEQIRHSITVTYDMTRFSYMSPEQALGKPVDHQSDIYSLGVIFYEMLSGKRLYQFGRDIENIKSIQDKIDRYCYFKTRPEKDIVPIKALAPDIPDELNSIVMKCLEDDKKLRYKSAQELYHDLREKVTMTYDKSHLAEFMKSSFGKDRFIGEKTVIKMRIRDKTRA